MNITSELEKLTSLRDRGDLSQAEFEKAKTLLLSEKNVEAASADETTPDALAEKKRKTRTQFAVAICATLAAALSGGSAIISPSPLTLTILVIWVVVSSLGWSSYSQRKTEIEKLEQSEQQGN